MTIQMLQQWNGLERYSVHTLDGGEETRLIAAGLAREWAGPAVDGSSPTPLSVRGLPGGGYESLDPQNSRQSFGAINPAIRWCIPGREVTGTLFQDISGRGNHATIEASNSGAFGVADRMGTTAATAGGIRLPLAAGLFNFLTDSVLMSVRVQRATPGANANLLSWGAEASVTPAGLYISHRTTGIAVVGANRGTGGVFLATQPATSWAISNGGGTLDTHLTFAYDGPTRSVYAWRNGVLMTADPAFMTGGNVWTAEQPTHGPRLGGLGLLDGAAVAGTFGGWQGYVWRGSGLPLNVGTMAAMLAADPNMPVPASALVFA